MRTLVDMFMLEQTLKTRGNKMDTSKSSETYYLKNGDEYSEIRYYWSYWEGGYWWTNDNSLQNQQGDIYRKQQD